MDRRCVNYYINREMFLIHYLPFLHLYYQEEHIIQIGPIEYVRQNGFFHTDNK